MPAVCRAIAECLEAQSRCLLALRGAECACLRRCLRKRLPRSRLPMPSASLACEGIRGRSASIVQIVQCGRHWRMRVKTERDSIWVRSGCRGLRHSCSSTVRDCGCHLARGAIHADLILAAASAPVGFQSLPMQRLASCMDVVL